MDICLKFGKRCREIRKEKLISQEKFALSVDMDRTYYSAIENGKRNVSLQNIEKIAKGFDISIEELFKGI